MSGLKYKITENPNYTMRSKVGIKTFPENEPLVFFLSSLKIDQFPHYINELMENINFGVENASFIFYDQMDWEDKAEFLKYSGREIQEDEIRISFYDGKSSYSALSRNDFEQVFYDYSEKILHI